LVFALARCSGSCESRVCRSTLNGSSNFRLCTFVYDGSVFLPGAGRCRLRSAKWSASCTLPSTSADMYHALFRCADAVRRDFPVSSSRIPGSHSAPGRISALLTISLWRASRCVFAAVASLSERSMPASRWPDCEKALTQVVLMVEPCPPALLRPPCSAQQRALSPCCAPLLPGTNPQLAAIAMACDTLAPLTSPKLRCWALGENAGSQEKKKQ